jgi:hypothetical protein
LPYPKNEMLIVGSGTMALLGLKKMMILIYGLAKSYSFSG